MRKNNFFERFVRCLVGERCFWFTCKLRNKIETKRNLPYEMKSTGTKRNLPKRDKTKQNQNKTKRNLPKRNYQNIFEIIKGITFHEANIFPKFTD